MEASPDRGKYSAERRTLQILGILRLLTDETHSLSKGELGRCLRLYRMAKYKIGTPLEALNTFTSTLEEILVELDSLIQMVCFSNLLSNEEKQRLVDKLVSTSSLYYQTPFYDGDRLKFSPQTIHGRFSTRAMGDWKLFAKKINRIQQVIKNLCQIRFRFNCYTSEHTMAPKADYLHVLSPDLQCILGSGEIYGRAFVYGV